jgi:hypothetical protein
MALIDLIPVGKDPAERTRLLGDRMGAAHADFMAGTLAGPELTLFQSLSSMMCWDAALYCAWSAKGIECKNIKMVYDWGGTVVSGNEFGRVFPEPRKTVASTDDLEKIPSACFIGFLRPNGVMGHVMLSTGKGFGVGNKNDCVLSDGDKPGFQRLDLRHFFGKDAGKNAGTKMIYAPITGQNI